MHFPEQGYAGGRVPGLIKFDSSAGLPSIPQAPATTLPDLRVAIRGLPSLVTSFVEPVSFHVELWNVGSVDTYSGSVTFTLPFGSNASVSTSPGVTCQMGNDGGRCDALQVLLAARKRFVVGLMTMTPVAKTNTVTATADTPQNIQESNEKNNTDTQTLTVGP